jgi:hypothetical protein
MCFPLPQRTSASHVKTEKTLDSPRLGRLSVLVLSALMWEIWTFRYFGPTRGYLLKPGLGHSLVFLAPPSETVEPDASELSEESVRNAPVVGPAILAVMAAQDAGVPAVLFGHPAGNYTVIAMPR